MDNNFNKENENGNNTVNMSMLVTADAVCAAEAAKDTQSGKITQSAVVEGERRLNITYPTSIIVCVFAFAMAVFYSICFTGIYIYPKLSMFTFTLIALVVLYTVLQKISYLKNKNAFKWAVPIIIISSFNAIFNINFFSYVNILIIHLMFAALGYSAVNDTENELSDISGWINLLKVCFGNFAASMRIFILIFKKNKEKKEKNINIITRIAIGVALAVPVLFILTVVLMDADAVFNSIMKNIFDSLSSFNSNTFSHIVVIVIATVYLTGYIYNLKNIKPTEIRLIALKADNIIGSTFLALINLLFLFFCIIQTAFLFTGGYMKLPEGIVYSAYAREGFFQLLFVTVINFTVIMLFLKIFSDCVKIKALKVLLSMLCVFTGILIFSSFYRMFLYIDAYGYTGIRMMVITFLSMEALLVIVTLRYLYKPDIDFLKRYIYIGVVFYMIVNITSSAYVVGRLNVNRFYAGKDLDIQQLCYNSETAGLLVEVMDINEEENFLSEEDKQYAYDAIIWLYQTNNDEWQNISLISTINKNKINRKLN